MSFDLVQIRKLARKKEDENWEFRAFLKGECDLESDEIDRRVFETTRRVWTGIDCTSCANCCRELQPSFSEEKVNRLAQRLDMPDFVFRTIAMLERTSTCPIVYEVMEDLKNSLGFSRRRRR
jgi:hypothetical protein